MTKRIAFIYFSLSSFMRHDRNMLSKYYDVVRVKFSGFKDVLKVINAVRTSDISYSWFADGWAFFAVLASKIFRKKSIVVVGGYDVANVPEIGYGMGTKNILRRWMVKYALKCADQVLPVSKFTQRETEQFTQDNIRMVYNGVDTDMFSPSDAEKETVLTVGNKIKLKGIDTFVSAAHHLPSRSFVIVGMDDDTLPELERYSNIPNNLLIVGQVSHEDMVGYYQRAKVYCQLSYRESFGMSLAESLACGCVPVVTDRGAMSEVVGDSGYYVPYGDIDATVDAIENAFGDKDMQTRKQIEDNFSLSRREAALKTVIDYNLKDARTRNRMRKSVGMANIQPGDSVLDLGCGDSAIKALFPNDVMYTGVDMISGDIHYDLETGIPKQLQSMKFDVIFLNEFIEHIENFKTILIQCRDMLSENGRIIVSTPSPNRLMFGEDPTHTHCFRKSNMQNLADICDLRVDKVTGTYLGVPYIPMISMAQTLLTGVIIYRLVTAPRCTDKVFNDCGEIDLHGI